MHGSCRADLTLRIRPPHWLLDCYPAFSDSKKYTPSLLKSRKAITSERIIMTTVTRFKLVFHVPTVSLAKCKEAIFTAGAGRYPGPGNYTECCWTVAGTGQFRPGDAAKPHLGKVGQLEEVEETRVETICVGEEVARNAVKALKG